MRMRKLLSVGAYAAVLLAGPVLAQQPAAPEDPGPVMTRTPPPNAQLPLLMQALQGTSVGDLLNSANIRIVGWVDGGYTYSSRGSGRLSIETLPNRFGDEFILNQVSLMIERPLDPKEFSWGFQLQGWAGADAALLNPIRGALIRHPDPRFGFDVPNAFLQVHLPILTEGGVDVAVGEHTPFIGAEPPVPFLRNFYSNDYQWFYGLPAVATSVIVTAHVNPQLDVINAISTGTPTFFTMMSKSPAYMGVANYWLEEDKKTKISLAFAAGPFNPQSSRLSTLECLTVTRNWNELLTQIVQFYAGYSEATVFVPGLQRAYGLYSIFSFHLNPTLDLNTRAEWYKDVDGLSYPGGTGFKTDYEEVTLGVNYHPTKWLQLRPELRGDFANDARAFGRFNGPGDHSQFTAAIDCLIMF